MYLFKEGLIYCDSQLVKGTESFSVNDKVKLLATPKRISGVVKIGSAKGVKRQKINDRIHGYLITGSNPHGERLVHLLFEEYAGDMALIGLNCKLASMMELYNDENYFEVILIGEKNNYSIDPERKDAVLHIFDPSESWGAGIGLQTAKVLIKTTGETFDPIRVMYAIEKEMPKFVKGPYYVWGFKTINGKKTFVQQGSARAIEGRDPLKLTHDLNKPYPLDWVLNKPLKENTPCQTQRTSPRSPPTSKVKILKNSQAAPALRKSVSKKSRRAVASK